MGHAAGLQGVGALDDPLTAFSVGRGLAPAVLQSPNRCWGDGGGKGVDGGAGEPPYAPQGAPIVAKRHLCQNHSREGVLPENNTTNHNGGLIYDPDDAAIL